MDVVAVDATIGDRTLRTLHYNHSTDTGRINRIQVPRLFPLLIYLIVTYIIARL